jgi:hypothetical protein
MGLLHYLAHSIPLRHFIENKLFRPARSWKKLTAAASFDQSLHALAHQDAAAYAYEHFKSAAYFQSKKELYDLLLEKVAGVNGLLLECGVYKADTLNYFAARSQARTWHGFDSFEGLPEDWGGGEKGKGAFSLGGHLPAVKANVQLHPGWFEHTVVPFLQAQKQSVAFVHLDADLYSSTKTVLEAISPYLQPGTLLLFDEYFGQIGWREGEHKALLEWLPSCGYEAHCVAYAANGAVLFAVTQPST